MTAGVEWVILTDGARLWWALGTVLLFALMCLWAGLKGRLRDDDGTPEFLILSASQTGQALELAERAEAQLRAGGKRVRRRSLRDATVEDLGSAPIILCIASTTGEGDAPDEALVFERRMGALKVDLAHQTYAVLALGDRKYEKFCAFGHRLHDWMGRHGARALKPCLEVDDLDPVVLSQWQDGLRQWGAVGNVSEAGFEAWTLTRRELLNPDSDAPGLYRVELDGNGQWQAGDLADILTPDGHRRDYSIASVPSEGAVSLFVREVIKPDGERGLGSGLLTHMTPLGGTVPLRLKSHSGFHAPEGDGPVLLIGAGSGLAGLRAHMIDLIGAGRKVWLIYGERHPVRDARLSNEMQQWQQGRPRVGVPGDDDGGLVAQSRRDVGGIAGRAVDRRTGFVGPLAGLAVLVAAVAALLAAPRSRALVRQAA